MNFSVNEITNSIAGKPSLSLCSIDELRQLTSQYPFFGPAQFLFVKKLKEENKIFAGMIPKLDNAFEALKSGVKKVIIGKAENLEQLINGHSGTSIINE